MTSYKLVRLILHLFTGLLKCALVFPLTNSATHERMIRSWSARLVRLCGVQLRIVDRSGGASEKMALIVSNHISWLDIFVINSLRPCRFVAKSDIRDWPLIGWLCHKVGTIFIARGRLREVRKIYQGLVTSLENGERIAFFPESTTVAQGQILPFHANLIEAAIDANTRIQPYALRYTDAAGNLHPAVDFVGDTTFMQSVLSIMRGRGIVAELTILPALESNGLHRRDLAENARQSIGSALGWMLV